VTLELLFIPTASHTDRLELTIARIAAVVGGGNVGAPQLLDSHRPEAIQLRQFSIVAAVSPASNNHSKHKPTANPQHAAAPAIALRAFRPPVPARVQLQGNKPASVFFQGRSGYVIHASGPWRTSGDWWEEQPWQEDAWDLEIVFSGESSPAQSFYRFSYDGLLDKWFVRGVYD
jgi:protein ImuB